MPLAEQQGAYWAAIAQIVPVLALALALEARLMARRFSRRNAGVSRRAQGAFAIWLTATWVLLFVAESIAIRALMPTGPASSDSNRANILLAGIAVMNGLFVVAAIPVHRVAEPGWVIIHHYFRFTLPWGKPQRLRRSIERAKVSIQQDLTNVRAARLDLLLRTSEALVRTGGLARLHKTVSAEVAGLYVPPEHREKLATNLAELQTLVSEALASFENSMKLIVQHDDLEAYLRDMIRRQDKHLRRLEKMRAGNSKRDERAFRSIWAEVART